MLATTAAAFDRQCALLAMYISSHRNVGARRVTSVNASSPGFRTDAVVTTNLTAHEPRARERFQLRPR